MPKKGSRLRVEKGGKRAKYCRMRLADPVGFDPRSFRTKTVKKGVKVVVGCPKGKFKGGVCKVGTRPQSMLKKKVDGTCPVFHPPKGQTRVK
jgi:hypothetical protein